MKLICSKLMQFVFLFCFLFLFSGKMTRAAEAPRTVKVGVYENRPKIFRDDTGQVTGLFGDILRYIAKQENWNLEFVDGSFDDGLNRVMAGEIDVMVDVAYSEERAKDFDFTKETVFGSWGVAYVRNESRINSFQDLDGKKIALLKSSVYRSGAAGIEQYIGAFKLNVEFIEVDEYAAVFNLLSSGAVDAAIVSRISGLESQKNYPNIRASDIIFSPTELRFALTKGDSDNAYLIDRLDFWIVQLQQGYEGAYAKILENHGLSGLISKILVTPPWILPTIVIGSLLLLGSWLLLFGMRRGRLLALKLLATKEMYLLKVVNSMSLIFTALDPSGVVTISEGKGLETIGLKPGQVVGRSGNEILGNIFGTDEHIGKEISKSLSGEEVRFETEISDRVFKTIAHPVKVNGQVTEVLLISIDVTDEALLNKAKKEFIYIVQHQLRANPTVINWTLELLAPKILPTLNREERKTWKTLSEANNRIISLANTISRISEMESGLFPVKLEEFDLTAVADEVISEFEPVIKNKKLKIVKKYGEVNKVTSDKIIIGTILQALISNAVHYCSDNGLINITLGATKDNWTLKVVDNGMGISKNLADKLFSPFMRGETGAKHYPEGIGLGLYTSKNLLKSLGGKIWFESKEGSGSTFYVEIPKGAGNS